jgi:hypothetical protein
VVLTVTALTASFASAGSNATVALGLSYALISAAGILLVQRAGVLAQSSRSNSGIYSANGFLAQPEDADRSGGHSSSDVVRDVCAAAGLATLVASVTLEAWHFGDLVYHHEWAGRSVVGNWVARNAYVGFAATIAILLVQILVYYSLLLMVSPRSCYRRLVEVAVRSPFDDDSPPRRPALLPRLVTSSFVLTMSLADLQAGRIHHQSNSSFCCRLFTARGCILCHSALVCCFGRWLCFRVHG